MKWDKENVFEESKKYTSRSEFAKNNNWAYNVARTKCWLDEMIWLKPKISQWDCCNYVYSFVFEEEKIAYVGLTNNFQRRINEHLCGRSSSVYNFSQKYSKQIPKPICLERNLSKQDAQIKEKEWAEFYLLNGYKLLNKGKLGLYSGSLGAINRKWTKNKVFEESKKYITRTEFSNGCRSAYDVAKKNKWLDEMYWFNTIWCKKWNKENVFGESKKYTSRSDFKCNNASAYRVARENKWLGEMYWLKRKDKHKPIKWTKEKILEEVKKYKTKTEFQKSVRRAYDAAKRNGWLEEIWSFLDNNYKV